MINMSIEFAHKMSLAYSATCKTLCRELKLPQKFHTDPISFLLSHS